ncbi:penicillin acylase family protein [Methylobacterium persicinum]|uniref:Penicillin amidase n=1 Tax=Methylobacterium persicinum TaxID=374426 RepID=A0ABU0HSG0_9HYPH|nr:penicillin acylase family protein [Methylobacterium persicinum]MDQ0444434.1 penicillin amidase [Methylobacterium persicinum]GJE39516.1 Penicillin acylase 2 proenzyme [Methylobacterium persicinum]
MSAGFTLPGLTGPAEIRIDRWGLAHIRAGSALDAFRVQGFNAARDRLWQLDLWRKRGLGLLAADFGPGFLAQDRAARLFLYRGDMAAEWAAYGPQDTKAIVTAFVGGLNAFIGLTAKRPDLLPPEFAVTGTAPALWAPEDVVRIRSHGLVRNVLSEVARAKVLARGGGLATDDLRKRLSPPHDVVVPEGLDAADWPDDLLDVFRLATAQVTFTPERMAATRAEAWAWCKVDAYGAVCRTGAPVPPEPAEGSNNWVVGPRRTDTERPILASDPHRVYLNPSLRYAVHLTAPGLDVIGAGEPALPGISIGHNGHAAFSLTIAPMDQEDLFVCEKHPDDPDLVRRDEGWERILRIADTIPVRGEAAEPVTLAFTRQGPVIAEDATRAFALATVWSAPGAAAYLGSLAYLGATTPEAFGDALRHWSAPSVNQLYADCDGRIAWFMAGKAPRRPAHDGLLPVPGDGRFDWDGFHNAAALPRAIDPVEGWLATANEMNLPPGYPAGERKLGFEWHEPWRANRIRSVLGGQEAHGIADSQALQADAFSEPALRIASIACAMPAGDRAEIRAAQDMLRGFDGTLAAGSAAAALVEVLWVRHLRPALIAALVPDPAIRRLIPPGDAESLIQGLESRLAPGRRDELLADTLAAAWATCRDKMGDDPDAWTWGRIHRALFTHPLSPLGAGGGWDVGPFALGGAGASPMHAEYRTDTFRITNGASFRMVVDVGAWDRSVFVNVPGQSGDPRSPHYRDLAEVWSRQEHVPMPYSPGAVEAATRDTILLTPATGA